MKRQIISILLVSCGLLLAGAAEAAGSNGIYLSNATDGSVELSNLSSTEDSELVIAGPELPTAPVPAYANSPEASVAAGLPVRQQTVESGRTADLSRTIAAVDASQLSSNEQYRNHMQQQVHGSAVGGQNPAASRRYLMQSRPQMASFGR